MQPIRVLIVEDEYIVASDLTHRLTAQGYVVVGHADNGLDALSMARNLAPDMVLMDVRIAGATDGIDTAIEMRRHQDVPVIFLTAFGEQSILDRAKQAQPYGYILKPFDDRELRVVIEMALSKYRGDQQLKLANARLEALWSAVTVAESEAGNLPGRVLAALGPMTRSSYAFYGCLNEDESMMTIHAWSGEAMQDCAMADKPQTMAVRDAGVWAEAVRRREPLILNDYAAAHPAKKGLPRGHVSLTRLLVVPMLREGRVVALAAMANRRDDYETEDVRQVLAFLGSIQMVLDNRRTHEALRESEYFFKESQRAAFIGSYKIDFTTGLWASSEVLDQIFGINRNHRRTVAGWLDIVHPDDRDEMDRYLREEVIGKRLPFSMEYRIIRKSDGAVRWVNGLGTVTISDAGIMLSMIGTIQDITERKQAAEEQRRMEKNIGNLQKLESLGMLAGGIAHDFNNLLGGVFGGVELALDTTQDPEVRALLGRAMGVMDAARGLTRQLLTFAKGGAPTLAPTPLFPLVQDTTLLALSGSRCQARFEVADDLKSCDCDKTQINQVVMNLVINADQAMPTGGTLTVTAVNVTLDGRSGPAVPAGAYVRLSFRDEGVGVPPALLSRIFDPFFTTKQKGSGLGLAMVHSIISRHGGTVEVESTQGQGTTFHVYLPIATRADTAAAVPAMPQQGAPQSGGTVLIMDDEKYMRDGVMTVLRSMGYTTIEATNGAEALSQLRAALARKERLVAALLDLTIPGGMGGAEAAIEIRKLDPGLPLIAASGYSDDPVIARPAEHGFAGSLEKPWRKADLAAALARVARQA
jgi:PAS domain S-box-containing protein